MCKFAKIALLSCLLFAPVHAQPQSSVPPPFGAVGEENGPVVSNVGQTQVRFPVIVSTNRRWTGTAYSHLERDPVATLPEITVRHCLMDKAIHRLGQRDDVQVEASLAPKPEVEALLAPAPAGQTKRYLVYVHGFTSTYEQSLASMAQIAFDINRHAAPVLFSWPSGADRNLDYPAARDNSRQSGYMLAKTLEFLQNQAGATIEVDLLAHSLGSETALEALEELDKTAFEPVRNKIRFKNIVFVAPDVAELDFRANLDWPVFGSTRTTLYTNSKDPILAVPSEAINFNSRVGIKTRFFHPRIQNIDVTPLFPIQSTNGHTSVLFHPLGLVDLFSLLKYDLGASQRNLYWYSTFWQMRP